MKTILAEEGYPLALRETYLAFIRGSVGSHQYRKLFVDKGDMMHDVIGDGDLACALYVSSILTLLGLLDEGIHTNVRETVIDMRGVGWETTTRLTEGAVIVWAPKLCTDNMQHAHIGFYLGGERAISNSSALQTPAEHDVYFRTPEKHLEVVRTIEYIFVHPRLR